MSWLQFSLRIDATLAAAISDFLEGLDALAVTTENAGADEFYEVAFPSVPSWQTVTLTALFTHDAPIESITASCLSFIQSFSDNEIQHTVTTLDDQDWERAWLDAFHPIEVGESLWVVPSWCEAPDPKARVIHLDPGLAFGTGTHATTLMCLAWLAQQDLSNKRVLDFGSGSGILAIAALHASATHADAVDIDPLAVEACEQNLARNNINGQPMTLCSDSLSTESFKSTNHRYQLVIANILADVLIELEPMLTERVADHGQILLTGILESQAQRVIDAYDSFDFEIQQKDHWVLLIGQHQPAAL